MEDHDYTRQADAAERTQQAKRGYRSPVLTQYGSVEDLVDAGVIGSAGTVPSLTSKAG